MRLVELDSLRKMLIVSGLHCKNSFSINSNTYPYKEGHNTVRNKGDLDSGMNTKTSNSKSKH